MQRTSPSRVESQERNRGYEALAEVEAHLAFKADTSSVGAMLSPPPKNKGRFRPMAVVEATAICASYSDWLSRWRETGQDRWPLANSIGSGENSSLCFKLRTGTRRTDWMYDGGGLIKFRGEFASWYHPLDGDLADRHLAHPERIKWAGWYAPRYPRRLAKIGLEEYEAQQTMRLWFGQ